MAERLGSWVAGWLGSSVAVWLDGCMAARLSGWVAGWLGGWVAERAGANVAQVVPSAGEGGDGPEWLCARACRHPQPFELKYLKAIECIVEQL